MNLMLIPNIKDTDLVIWKQKINFYNKTDQS
jgi:hypothetical protein